MSVAQRVVLAPKSNHRNRQFPSAHPDLLAQGAWGPWSQLHLTLPGCELETRGTERFMQIPFFKVSGRLQAPILTNATLDTRRERMWYFPHTEDT